MSRLDYTHTQDPKGTGQGKPIRRASHLYDKEPNRRYPNVLNFGTTQASQYQYGEDVFHVPPHVPVTLTFSPYIDNPEAGGNFTRYRYIVMKRGMPCMAALKRDVTVNAFVNDGTGTADVEERTYVDPAQLATNGTIKGFHKPGVYVADDIENTDPVDYFKDAAEAGYCEVTEANPVPGEVLFAAPDADQQGFRAVYQGVEDTNDKIATGGTNMYAVVDEALFGSSDYDRQIVVDADGYYFGGATSADGFLLPSTGGTQFTAFFNEVDAEAGVSLPVTDDEDRPVTVEPLTATIDQVTVNDIDQWKFSAVSYDPYPTVGVMHTEIENSDSQRYYHFQTGTPQKGPRSVIKDLKMKVPFVDIRALKQFINTRTPLNYNGDPDLRESFNFTRESDVLSGIKTGLYGNTTEVEDISAVNLASYPADGDAGYLNLRYNFAAPFLTTTELPDSRTKLKSDLFSNYTVADHAALKEAATNDAGTNPNPFGLDDDLEHNKMGMNMADVGLETEVIGRVLGLMDFPAKTLEALRIDPIWQSRVIGNTSRNALNEGYRRMGGTASTAGLEQLISDFGFMLFGGGNYAWASQPLVKFDGSSYDLSVVLKEAVKEGVIGMVRFRMSTVGI